MLSPVNTPVLGAIQAPETRVILPRVEDAELAERWSFVGHQKQPRWRWQALDHRTGEGLAYLFGRRQDEVFLELKTRLEPFGIRHYFTDGWGAYQRHLDPEQHAVGQRNPQPLERQHLTRRTRIKRLARKTIGFSKSTQMHDTVIGLFMNRVDFGLSV